MAQEQGEIKAGSQGAAVYHGARLLNYLLFVPEAYGREAARAWPLILYLHGLGESGDDPALLTRTGLPQLLETKRDLPFIILSPQCPDDVGWWAILQDLDGLLQQVVTEYAVDEERVYLTGNSMGGYGAWALAASHPERFAAVAPICGGGSPEMACALAGVPVWAFHGAADDIVPLAASQQMVEALRECDGDVRFTVYPGVGHDSWTPTYHDQALYDWFLQHRRPR